MTIFEIELYIKIYFCVIVYLYIYTSREKILLLDMALFDLRV